MSGEESFRLAADAVLIAVEANGAVGLDAAAASLSNGYTSAYARIAAAAAVRSASSALERAAANPGCREQILATAAETGEQVTTDIVSEVDMLLLPALVLSCELLSELAAATGRDAGEVIRGVLQRVIPE